LIYPRIGALDLTLGFLFRLARGLLIVGLAGLFSVSLLVPDNHGRTVTGAVGPNPGVLARNWGTADVALALMTPEHHFNEISIRIHLTTSSLTPPTMPHRAPVMATEAGPRQPQKLI